MDWSITGRLRIGGHRGALDVAPENTLAGFEAAAGAGVDYLEIDVHRSADGVLVVIHDPTVDRTTNGCGRVAELSLAELRALDAGVRFGPDHAGQRIPTFAEFLGWMEARSPLGAAIEAKADGIGAEIAEAIARSSSRRHFLVSSFKPAELEAAKGAVPDIPCLLLLHSNRPVEDPVSEARACGADGVDGPGDC